MLARLRGFIFFLIIFCISFQVGYHFWPDFSYVNGIRIDYLSPTLYLLDILIFAFIALSIFDISSFLRQIKLSKIISISLLLFVLTVVLNLFLAKSVASHAFGIFKLLEFILFGISIAIFFRKKHIRYFIDALSLSAILSSILAIWQFLTQGSVGGFWYFLGERTFNSLTIGISTVNLNEQLLRSYAAFPHPNVLAFFLFMTVAFVTLRISYEKNIYEKWFLIFTILISSTALILTFSRISIFLLITFLFYVIYTNIKSNRKRFGLVLSGFVLLLLLYFLFPWSQQFLLRGLDFRADLLSQSLIIFMESPYFGIGLNNFFIHQAPLIKSVTPILFQPPHNIYVLALLSLGLFGFALFPYLLFSALRKCFEQVKTKDREIKAFYRSAFIVLVGILIVGLFDHFFLTLEQGQVMLALIIGMYRHGKN